MGLVQQRGQRGRPHVFNPYGKRRFKIEPEPGQVHIRYVRTEYVTASQAGAGVPTNGKIIVPDEAVDGLEFAVEVIACGEPIESYHTQLAPGTHALFAPRITPIMLPWSDDGRELIVDRRCIVAVLGEEIPAA